MSRATENAAVDADWKSRYASRVVTRETALSRIQRGGKIFVGSACAEPQYLVEGLAQRAANLADSEILSILTLGIAPYTDEKLAKIFRHNAFFIGDNTRRAVAEGRADYTPVYLSELPQLFRSRRTRVDAALIQVTPPDRHGYVSLGVSVDVTKAAVESARVVIAEVNPRMPRTLGDSFIPVDRIDYLVEHAAPVIEYLPPTPDDVASRIGGNIARLVSDGATIQIGIGSIPNAAVHALRDKRDLGVHTEMFSDWLLDLVRAGAVTNRRKTLHRGKAVASFCMGTQDLYDFIDNNPMVELHPSEYTNDPYVIGQNDNMVSINTALEIDLTGQVCSDSIGHQFYSGIGGQVDFIRGAARSAGGKPIIALPSTARGDAVTRIVPQLSPGAGVVTTRASARYVVTEWGYTDLHGRTIRERAMALINIAHPKFRKELLEAAKRLHYVYPDQIIPTSLDLYPEKYEQRTVLAGREILVRPVRATDEPLLKDLFYSLSDESVYRRYFNVIKYMPHERLQEELDLDYQSRMAIAAVAEQGGVEEMVGLAQYVLDESTNFAEAAFLVRDEWQGKGLGGHLVRTLVRIAQDKGVRGITAEVMPGNRAMLHLFYKLGYTVESRLEEGAYHLEFLI
ncbi:MAG: GNAT family N-acetyltransferase [Deferrisomatales bacterium]|nr:GNAT family N-acetyltransferase [Deferrisomatales bacterium]